MESEFREDNSQPSIQFPFLHLRFIFMHLLKKLLSVCILLIATSTYAQEKVRTNVNDSNYKSYGCSRFEDIIEKAFWLCKKGQVKVYWDKTLKLPFSEKDLKKAGDFCDTAWCNENGWADDSTLYYVFDYMDIRGIEITVSEKCRQFSLAKAATFRYMDVRDKQRTLFWFDPAELSSKLGKEDAVLLDQLFKSAIVITKTERRINKGSVEQYFTSVYDSLRESTYNCILAGKLPIYVMDSLDRKMTPLQFKHVITNYYDASDYPQQDSRENCNNIFLVEILGFSLTQSWTINDEKFDREIVAVSFLHKPNVVGIELPIQAAAYSKWSDFLHIMNRWQYNVLMEVVNRTLIQDADKTFGGHYGLWLKDDCN